MNSARWIGVVAGITSIGAPAAARTRAEPGAAQRRGGALHRHDTRRAHLEQLATAAVEPARRMHDVAVELDVDHAERLFGAEVRGDERWHAARTAVERVVAAPDPLGVGDVVGDRGGDVGARRGGGRFDADGTAWRRTTSASRSTLSAPGGPDGDRGDPVVDRAARPGAARTPAPTGRPPTCRRTARRAVRPDGWPTSGRRRCSSSAHVRRKTTPWPPSG